MGQFERIRYPDGQIGAKYLGSENGVDNFLIKERINSYEDLAYIYSIANVINHSAANNLHTTPSYRLFIPCLFGQRSDRRFSEQQSFDLAFIAHVINECDFGKVSIFDPHSDVCMALINNSVKISSFEYVNSVVKDIYINKMIDWPQSGEELILVAPDAGAYKKVFEYGEKLNLPVMGAMKHRDKDGKIDLMFTHDVEGKDCLIVDDLCDGGYTFLVLAEALRKQGARKVYLYVSHGLFSKGFSKLAETIDHIYCTNSVKDINMDEVFELKFPDGALAGIKTSDFVTQYKII